MSPRAQVPRMDMHDPDIAARLDATGIPGALAKRLARMGIQVSMVERLHRAQIDWEFVTRLLHTPGLRASEDVPGLLAMARGGMSEQEIYQWATLGSLDVASRLDAKNVPVTVVAAFPLAPDRRLGDFLRMVQEASQHNMRTEDLLLWHTAGALSLSPPYVVPDRWGLWRSVAVHAIGMRRAAVAAAAGLTPREAVDQVTAGTFDEPVLRMLAGLRGGGAGL